MSDTYRTTFGTLLYSYLHDPSPYWPLGQPPYVAYDPNLTQAVRLRKYYGKVIQECDEYVGRYIENDTWQLPESMWANPYLPSDFGGSMTLTLFMYKQHILNDQFLYDQLHTLRGKRLGCFCKPRPCHADVLVELASTLP